MKLAVFAVVLLVALFFVTLARRRAAAREAEMAARARARAARNRQAVPAVSSNLKGVTASQTMRPYRPGTQGTDEDGGDDERAA